MGRNRRASRHLPAARITQSLLIAPLVVVVLLLLPAVAGAVPGDDYVVLKYAR